MHVIWAIGQDTKQYHHFPKSGLERDDASVKDFYKADELKYHGHGGQRGVTTINFFGKIFTKFFKYQNSEKNKIFTK